MVRHVTGGCLTLLIVMLVRLSFKKHIPRNGIGNRACVGTALAPGDLVEIKVPALKQR